MDWLPLVCSMNKRMMKMKFWSEHDTVGALLIDHHGQYRRPLTSDIPVHNHYPLWSVPQNNNNNQNCNRFMSLKCFDIFLYFTKISKKMVLFLKFCEWKKIVTDSANRIKFWNYKLNSIGRQFIKLFQAWQLGRTKSNWFARSNIGLLWQLANETINKL